MKEPLRTAAEAETACGTGDYDRLIAELDRVAVLHSDAPELLPSIQNVRELWKDWRCVSAEVASKIDWAREVLEEATCGDTSRREPTATDSTDQEDPAAPKPIVAEEDALTDNRVIHQPTERTTTGTVFSLSQEQKAAQVHECFKACGAKVAAGLNNLRQRPSKERVEGAAALLRAAARDLDDAVSLYP